MNVFQRNEAIDAMLEAHAAGKISNENLSMGGDMISDLYNAQPAAELSKWNGSPRIVGAAEWTSYRDGRRVMHYMAVLDGRYYVQKVAEGYAVSYMAHEGDGASVRLSLEATLAAGKKWVADHLAAAPTKTSLADDELYECEIPGTHGRVTLGVPHAVTDTITLGGAAFERVMEVVEATGEPSERLKALMRPTIGMAFGPTDCDPATLDYTAVPLVMRGEVEHIDVTCWEDSEVKTVPVMSFVTYLLPPKADNAPIARKQDIQFVGRATRQFCPVIIFTPRPGIKKIVVAKKGVDLGPWA